MNQGYLDTARLLVQAAPLVFSDDTFALKGGTAINLFIRDMPRLSVDLDLVFRDHSLTRDQALAEINAKLKLAREKLVKQGFQVRDSAADEQETKLMARRDGVSIKIEVNHVIRGTVNAAQSMPLTQTAQEALEAEIEIPVVSLADVYGGKLVAAMDRQHPRDLFDVMQLFEHEGITPEIQRAFTVYIASHGRPIHEVLFSNSRDIKETYERHFVGMTTEAVKLDALLAARERMFKELQTGLNAVERAFLISVARNTPAWDSMEIPHLSMLPAIQWKLHNLGKLQKTDPKKFNAQASELEKLLS